MLSRIRAISSRVFGRNPQYSRESRTFSVDPEILLQYLANESPRLSSQSLRRFCSFKPDVHLGLVFYDELYDIVHYWNSLTAAQRAISKHIFFLDYIDATAFPVLDTIFWMQGRSSHGIFPRPSPANSRLLTLANAEGRLRISIVPDGKHPTHYPCSLHAASVTRNIVARLESEFRKPSSSIPASLALALLRIIMVASDGGMVPPNSSKLDEPPVLGELVVENSERAFWDSQVQFRHHLPVSPQKSYKWTWHDDTTTGIYHGIPGWTRFALKQGRYSRAATIVLGDVDDNVDDWRVLLACLANWAEADLVRTFCRKNCSGSTRVGFVTQIYFATHISGFTPLPGFAAADTVYLFVEDLKVEADGHVAPYKGYYSLDRTGATHMSEGLQALYGLHESLGYYFRKYAKFLSSEQYAALDELRTRFGETLSGGALGLPSAAWRDTPSRLRRPQSATRLGKADWRFDWMMEDIYRERSFNDPWRGIFVVEPPEEIRKRKDPVRRLHRSKTKSVGGGMSLIYSRIIF